MSALELPLSRLQRWMQDVVVHPGPVTEALRSRTSRAIVAPESIARVILPSATLRPDERLAIYHAMYPLRMREALASDYPALEHFLGEEAFTDLVSGYIRAHPSMSYTLNRLGDHMPAFVRRARVKHRAFCHDLARLELAVTEAFDAQDSPRLGAAEVAAVPEAAWAKARLRPVASLRVLVLRYPVNAYLQSVKDDEHDHPRPRRKDGYVAVYRRNQGVYRLELSRAAHDLLRDLARGLRLGAALRAAARRGGRRGPGPQDLSQWFRDWVAAGLFASVET